MEAFQQKILRLSGKEFLKEYEAMTREERGEFAAKFLREESIGVLVEQGAERTLLEKQRDNQLLIKEALKLCNNALTAKNK